MSFSLAAYLARIGVAPEVAARVDLAALDAMILGHLRTIPFENLDLVLLPEPRPIGLGIDAVAGKLVDRRRGGYCFEHNTLLAAALRALGFEVVTLAARVRLGATGPTARNHMFLEVTLGPRTYLADVGFGSTSPTRAIRFKLGDHVTDHGTLRMREAGELVMLELEDDDAKGWSPQYAFNREEQYPIDYVVANHFTSTHPSSFFTQAPVIALTTERGRLSYSGGTLTERTGTTIARETIADADGLLELLATRFGLEFPAGTRFKGSQLPARSRSAGSPDRGS